MNASNKCGSCGKTVYPQEKIVAVGKQWHKLCFKCQGEGCSIKLNLNNFKGHDGSVYCQKCVPKAKSTAVADSLLTRQALNAPKKQAEGLGQVQKGTGEKPNVSLDSQGMKSALSAPKVKSEGIGHVQKGDAAQTEQHGGSISPRGVATSATEGGAAAEEAAAEGEEYAEEYAEEAAEGEGEEGEEGYVWVEGENGEEGYWEATEGEGEGEEEG